MTQQIASRPLRTGPMKTLVVTSYVPSWMRSSRLAHEGCPPDRSAIVAELAAQAASLDEGRCEVCRTRPRAGLERCAHCGRDLCATCSLHRTCANGPDGEHRFPVDDIDDLATAV